MSKQNKSEMRRINPKLREDLMDAGYERVKKGLLNPRELTMPKMTELATRTLSYQNMLNELKMKPEKKKVI